LWSKASASLNAFCLLTSFSSAHDLTWDPNKYKAFAAFFLQAHTYMEERPEWNHWNLCSNLSYVWSQFVRDFIQSLRIIA
jgi:hypothetical protein